MPNLEGTCVDRSIYHLNDVLYTQVNFQYLQRAEESLPVYWCPLPGSPPRELSKAETRDRQQFPLESTVA